MALYYLDDTLPRGFAGAVEALYRFDGSADSLTDRSGNGHTLSAASGGVLYTPVNGFMGLGLDGATTVRTGADAALQRLGAITVELVFCVDGVSSSDNQVLIGCGYDDTETEATNWVWSIVVTQNTMQWFYRQESDSGTNSEYTFVAMCPVCVPQYLALTRNSAGTAVSVYLGDRRVGYRGGLTAPTGGSSGRLHLGGVPEATNEEWFHGVVFGARVTTAEMSAAQVRAAYGRAASAA